MKGSIASMLKSLVGRQKGREVGGADGLKASRPARPWIFPEGRVLRELFTIAGNEHDLPVVRVVGEKNAVGAEVLYRAGEQRVKTPGIFIVKASNDAAGLRIPFLQ